MPLSSDHHSGRSPCVSLLNKRACSGEPFCGRFFVSTLDPLPGPRGYEESHQLIAMCLFSVPYLINQHGWETVFAGALFCVTNRPASRDADAKRAISSSTTEITHTAAAGRTDPLLPPVPYSHSTGHGQFETDPVQVMASAHVPHMRPTTLAVAPPVADGIITVTTRLSVPPLRVRLLGRVTFHRYTSPIAIPRRCR